MGPGGETQPIRIGAFGMAPDTANMGVSALCKSFLAAMKEAIPNVEPVIFDNGSGLRRDTLLVGQDEVTVLRCGARSGRRFYRSENLFTMAVMAAMGRFGRLHPVVRLIDSCAAIVDASAGDSFSDIYGEARFRSICLPKLITARRGRPLLLLPQTYGPYAARRNAEQASQLVAASVRAWARDANSYGNLQRLLGEGFDTNRHHCGVDMAFGLPVREPDHPDMNRLRAWFGSHEPVVGLNISGLVWHLGEDTGARFGFRADYRQLVCRALRWLLNETRARILLIPHVLAPQGDRESDRDASRAALATLDADPNRVRLAPEGLEEQELKSLIRRCNWFCGTRMHATIAALSSGVPAASIVYSDKAEGVFACCGQQDHIIDPRVLDTEEALAAFQRSYLERQTARAQLTDALVTVRATLAEQNRSITRFTYANAWPKEREGANP